MIHDYLNKAKSMESIITSTLGETFPLDTIPPYIRQRALKIRQQTTNPTSASNLRNPEGLEWVYENIVIPKIVHGLESIQTPGASAECYSTAFFELAPKMFGDLGQILYCMGTGNIFASGDRVTVSHAKWFNMWSRINTGTGTPPIVYENSTSSIGYMLMEPLNKKDIELMDSLGIPTGLPINI